MILLADVSEIQKIMFIVIPIIIVLSFVSVLAIFFSSKLRGKMMSKQMEAMKHMTNYSQDDMEDILTNMRNVSINSLNNSITQNEDTLRNIANKQADINKDAIRTTASAIKEGFTDNATIYCKHCGTKIDADSRFCKACGKEQ